MHGDDSTPDRSVLPPDFAEFLQKFNLTTAEHLAFLGAFLRDPRGVGAFAPSSVALGRAMLEECDLLEAETVVELGPGTGVFTQLILDRIGRRTTFIALERGEQQVRGLRRRFPSLDVYHDSAEETPRYLALHGRKRADCIISGLPWGSMPQPLRRRILRSIVSSLAPGGMFVTFSYLHAKCLPSSRCFRRALAENFAEVSASRVIWRNTLPAFVYRCRSPKG